MPPPHSEVIIQDEAWVLPDLPGSPDEAMRNLKVIRGRIHREVPLLDAELTELAKAIHPLPTSQVRFPVDIQPQIKLLLKIIHDPEMKVLDKEIMAVWERFQNSDRVLGMTDSFLSFENWETAVNAIDKELFEKIKKSHHIAQMSITNTEANKNQFMASRWTSNNAGEVDPINDEESVPENNNWNDLNKGKRFYQMIFVNNFNVNKNSNNGLYQSTAIQASRDARMAAEFYSEPLKKAWAPLVAHCRANA